MSDKEQYLEVMQIWKKLDSVSTDAFIAAARCLSTGATIRQAVECGNDILIKAGRAPVSVELFDTQAERRYTCRK